MSNDYFTSAQKQQLLARARSAMAAQRLAAQSDWARNHGMEHYVHPQWVAIEATRIRTKPGAPVDRMS